MEDSTILIVIALLVGVGFVLNQGPKSPTEMEEINVDAQYTEFRQRWEHLREHITPLLEGPPGLGQRLVTEAQNFNVDCKTWAGTYILGNPDRSDIQTVVEDLTGQTSEWLQRNQQIQAHMEGERRNRQEKARLGGAQLAIEGSHLSNTVVTTNQQSQDFEPALRQPRREGYGPVRGKSGRSRSPSPLGITDAFNQARSHKHVEWQTTESGQIVNYEPPQPPQRPGAPDVSDEVISRELQTGMMISTRGEESSPALPSPQSSVSSFDIAELDAILAEPSVLSLMPSPPPADRPDFESSRVNPDDKVAEAAALRTQAAKESRKGDKQLAIVLERQANTMTTGDATKSKLLRFEEPAVEQYRSRLGVINRAVMATNDAEELRGLRAQLGNTLPASWEKRQDQHLWTEFRDEGRVNAPTGWHAGSRINTIIGEKLDGTFGAGARREHPRSKSFAGDVRPSIKKARSDEVPTFDDSDL